MAQDNSSDGLNSKFSVLNVNAMEFVPSFGCDADEDESPVNAQAPAIVPEVPPAAAAEATGAPVAVATVAEAPIITDDDSVPASTISSSNNNGTCRRPPISVWWSCNNTPGLCLAATAVIITRLCAFVGSCLLRSV